MNLQKITIGFIVLLASVTFGFDYPSVPESSKNHLFKIGRSRDANEIMYDLNFDKYGKLAKDRPIKIYWIKRTNNNNKEPLTRIQKRFAYGLKFLDLDRSRSNDSKIDFQFVSYSKRTFTLKKDRNNQYIVVTLSKNKEVMVNRIFVQIDGGTFWIPVISRVELHAIDIHSGKKVLEIINP